MSRRPRARVSKANARTSGVTVDYRILHRIADAQVRPLAATIAAALNAAYASTSDLDAYNAYTTNPETVRRTIAWDKVAAILGAPEGTFTVYKARTFADILASIYTDAGTALTYSDGRRTIRGGFRDPITKRGPDLPFGVSSIVGTGLPGDVQTAAMTARLDMVSAAATQYAAERAGTLITVLDQQGLQTVRGVMGKVLGEGLEPARAGRLLRSTVGLNERQGMALANYERGLWEKYATGTTSVILNGAGRPLADARYSLSNLDRDKIDKMVNSYRERLVNYRAEMIARTETMRAANTGALNDFIAHGQGMNLFDLKQTQRIWQTVPDDRTCDICGFMDGQTVGFSDQFTYDGVAAGAASGDVLSGETPPIHPMCRCTVIFDVTIESLENAFARGPLLWDPPPVDLGEWRDARWGAPGSFPQFTTPSGYTTPTIAEPTSLVPPSLASPMPTAPTAAPAPYEYPTYQPGTVRADDVDAFIADMKLLEDTLKAAGEHVYEFDNTVAGGDKTLAYLYRSQGFDGLPAVGTEADVTTAVENGGKEVWRGMEHIRDRTDPDVPVITHAESLAQQYREGDYYAGYGIRGNGTYTTDFRETAWEHYAGQGPDNGTLMRMAINPDANMIDIRDLENRMRAFADAVGEEVERRILAGDTTLGRVVDEGWGARTRWNYSFHNILQDPGRMGTYWGYDGYVWRDPPFIPRDAGTEAYHIVLNRTATIVQNTAAW